MGTDKDYQKKKKVGSMAVWPLFMDRIDMSPGYVPLLDRRLLVGSKQTPHSPPPPPPPHIHTHTHTFIFLKKI